MSRAPRTGCGGSSTPFAGRRAPAPLPTGKHERVDLVEIGGRPDEPDIGTELLETLAMPVEVALQREHADVLLQPARRRCAGILRTAHRGLTTRASGAADPGWGRGRPG